MKLSTRLLLPLLPTVAGIMTVYGAWALIQREATLLPAAQRETQVYGRALGLAFEYAIRDLGSEQVQRILNEVSREPSIYGILVYDARGRTLFVSDPLRQIDAAPTTILRPVLQRGETVNFEREIEDQGVYSVIRPIRDARRRITGALEVAQPLGFVAAEKARTGRRYLLNTLTLLLAVTAVTVWLIRRLVARPLEELVVGAQALGRGELSYRIDEQRAVGELGELAREFNRMARHLEDARADLLRGMEERVALERRLQDAEKLAGVGRVAAGLAHEVAAPLNVISGRAEMMLREEPVPPGRERNLRIIRDQIARITRIIRSRLDFARRREPRFRPVDLVAVADRVAEFLSAELAARAIRLERIGTPEARVNGDPDLLHQALTNLVVNATHALETVTGRERRITVRLEVVSAGNGTAPGHVVVEVEDTGAGIPEQVRHRIFEPFFTTKPRGTGLGLALTRGIVEDHGGTIEVVPGAHAAGGTIFRITLPAVAHAAPVDA